MKTVPVINLNGNSKESLVEQAMKIHNALDFAMQYLADSDLTHGRNFQTCTDTDAYFRARAERTEEFQWLETKVQEYLDLAIALSEQGR